MADAPRVFLSYSHDSAEHADRVLALAYALRDRGIDVILDRFVHPAPGEHLPCHPIRPDPVPRFLRRALLERAPLRPDGPGPGRRQGGSRLDPLGSGRRGE
ncbi:MAG: hypothetical protein JO329_23655 [Planctomycetaceae bacterium]|nr:hypothetical protein [Planctomycetaceae bacterium]MBV8266650.1 hypothetical protein [Planctomycetaceae bacterium]MBV8611128.1 hypothetical protein [Singulisphaera sp.]